MQNIYLKLYKKNTKTNIYLPKQNTKTNIYFPQVMIYKKYSSNIIKYYTSCSTINSNIIILVKISINISRIGILVKVYFILDSYIKKEVYIYIIIIYILYIYIYIYIYIYYEIFI